MSVPPAPAVHAWLTPRVAAVLLVLLTLAAYHRTLSVPFLFDDLPAIVANPALAPLWPPTADLWSNPDGGVTTSGRPLTAFTFALNHAWHGLSVRGYHVVNFALHSLNGLLLFSLLHRIFGRLPPAFAIAAVWLVHPLPTAAVTYLAQRAELLAATGVLAALCAFARAPTSRYPWLGYSLAWLAGAGAMAAKETAAATPLLLLLYDRTFVAPDWRTVLRLRGRWHAAYAGTWILLLGLVVSSAGRGATAGFDAGVSPWSYLWTQAGAITRYLRQSVWPSGLTFDYGTAVVAGPGAVLLPLALIVALLGLMVWSLRHRPAVGFALFACFALLAPSSSFVPIVTQTVAEHRMYLPLAAVLTLVVAGLRSLLPSRLQLPAGILAVVVGLALTLDRNHDYRSALALWSDTVAKQPANPRAHHNLGQARLEAGDVTGALDAFDAAQSLDPASPEIQYNRGVALARLDRPGEAAKAYTRTLELDPAHAEAANNLGNLHLNHGRPGEAIIWHRRATALKPAWPEAWHNLALGLLAAGETAAAVPAAERAVHLRPDWPDARFTWARSLAVNRRPTEALDQLEHTLRLAPDHIPARQARIDLLIDTGRFREAAATCEELLRLTPNDPQAQQLLRWLRARF